MNWTPRWGLIALLVTAGLGLAGCGGGSTQLPGPTPPPTGDTNPDSKLGLPKLLGLPTEVQPDTRVLGTGELAGLKGLQIGNPDACAPGKANRLPCQYSFDLAPLPADVKVGSVLVAGVSAATPDGLLVRVSALNGTQVSATEATLGDALRQGEFEAEREFSEADVRSQNLLPGLSVVPRADVGAQTLGKQASIPIKVNHVQLLPGVYADGQINLSLSCGAYGGLTYSLGVIPTGVKFQATCEVDQNLSLDLSASAEKTLSKEVTLGSLNLSPIVFSIGPVPVVLVPKVTLVLGLDGKVAASLTFGFSEEFQAKGGVGYDDGFKAIHSYSANAHAHPVGAQFTVSAKARLTAKASLMLYGVAGMSLNVGPTLGMEGGLGHNPLWCLTAGVKGDLSLDLDLKIKKLSYTVAELFNEEAKLGCADNAPPTISIEALTTLDAEHTLYLFDAAEVNLRANVNDPEDGTQLRVRWQSDRDGDLGTIPSGIPDTLMLHTLGKHVLTASVTDSGGKTASATFTVNVVKPVPTISLSARDSQGGALPGPEISLSQGDFLSVSATVGYLNIGLPCSSVTWEASGMTLTGGGCQVGLSLPNQGTFTLRATVNDGHGNTASASLTIKVGPPPVKPAPQFSAITAVKTSPAPVKNLNDGDDVLAQDVVQFTVNYQNSDAAGVKARYTWTVSVDGGSPQTLSGSAAETTVSQRNYTVPYLDFRPIVVEVKIYDATTNALIGDRVFHMIGGHIIF